MRNNMKRILSLILCIAMLMGVMPTSAFAAEMVDPSDMVSVQEYTDSGPVPEDGLQEADETVPDDGSGEETETDDDETSEIVLDDSSEDDTEEGSGELSEDPLSSGTVGDICLLYTSPSPRDS